MNKMAGPTSFCTFTMKVFLAIAITVMAGLCQANPVDDLSETGYRCPVKDKFLNRGNSFDYVQDIDSWQACGKNIEYKNVEPILISLHSRTNLRQNCWRW